MVHQGGSLLALWRGPGGPHPGRMSVEFWVTSIIMTATPGTGALFTIAAGLARGARAGLVAALGCALGIIPHLVVALTGAAAVLVASPVAFEMITWLGVAYLLFMAWGMWRETGALAPVAGQGAIGTSPSVARVIASAVLVNVLNPKLTIYFFIVLPMFTDPAADGAASQMVGLGVALMAITLTIFAIYGVCAAWVRQYVMDSPVVMRWIARGFATSFVAVAGMLALAQL